MGNRHGIKSVMKLEVSARVGLEWVKSTVKGTSGLWSGFHSGSGFGHRV